MARSIKGYIETATGVKKYREMVVRDLVAVEDAATMTREQNVAGLSSAITLANEARADIISHFAEATRHSTAAHPTTTIPAAATNLASLLALTASLLTHYEAHNADAILAIGWAYHDAQDTDRALASAAAPTTLQLAVTRLNDLKAKYNLHEAQTTSHVGGTVAGDEIASADAAYGTANLVPVTGCTSGCRVFWSILNSGTGTVTGVSASAGAGGVTFTFSADPQNNAIISYMVARPAA